MPTYGWWSFRAPKFKFVEWAFQKGTAKQVFFDNLVAHPLDPTCSAIVYRKIHFALRFSGIAGYRDPPISLYRS